MGFMNSRPSVSNPPFPGRKAADNSIWRVVRFFTYIGYPVFLFDWLASFFFGFCCCARPLSVLVLDFYFAPAFFDACLLLQAGVGGISFPVIGFLCPWGLTPSKVMSYGTCISKGMIFSIKESQDKVNKIRKTEMIWTEPISRSLWTLAPKFQSK